MARRAVLKVLITFIVVQETRILEVMADVSPLQSLSRMWT